MSDQISTSKAEEYARQKGWLASARPADDHIILETCPMCAKDNYHFYLNISPEKDGLWDCKVCGKFGNLYQLKEHLGDQPSDGVQSQRDWAERSKKPDALPNVLGAWQRLVNDQDTLDYLITDRGLSREIIDERKLGLMEQGGKKYLLIPYLREGQIIFAKYRTLPPNEKMFFISKGHKVPLYNEPVIERDMDELIIVEGEMDALTLIDQGITNVIGIPGANAKKLEWLSKIDAAVPKKMYILFDRDKAGQEGAAELAKKMTLNTQLPTPLNMHLPEFAKTDGDPGKDVNEWFRAGHTVEEFNKLKEAALPFEVRGVKTIGEALDRFEAELEGKELLTPRYVTYLPALNRKLGGFERGDVIDIIAKEKIGKTTFAMNLLDHLVATYNEPGLLYCLEMPIERMARKWVSYVTRTDDSPAMDDDDARRKLQLMKAAIPMAKSVILAREADLMFGYNSPNTPEEAFDTIRQAVRRHGCRFVVFDNMQALCDTTLKNANHRTVHMSQISKNFKKLTMDLELVLFRIIQPRGVTDDVAVSHNHADGSSQLSKDCDTTIALNRAQKAVMKTSELAQIGFIDEEIAMEPQLFTRVSISRYAPGGQVTLKFEGEYSSVTEYAPNEIGTNHATGLNLQPGEVPKEY